MKTTYLIIFAFLLPCCLLISSCDVDPNPDLEIAERVLPGNWNIESVNISTMSGGVRFLGETLEKDTILSNVGTLTIPNFEMDSMSLSGNDVIECTYTLNGESDYVHIESIFAISNESEVVYYWRRNGFINKDDADPDIKKFLDDSKLFWDNYYAEIIDTETVEFIPFSNRHGPIRLTKID